MPVDLAQAAGSCQILDLVLGPLDLDLLGLQVHLDTVHLNITAQSGPGNLVGNLLCAIAGLLNGGLPLSGILGQIAALLNQLLGHPGLTSHPPQPTVASPRTRVGEATAAVSDQ